jgi:hypothetical protein
VHASILFFTEFCIILLVDQSLLWC